MTSASRTPAASMELARKSGSVNVTRGGEASSATKVNRLLHNCLPGFKPSSYCLQLPSISSPAPTGSHASRCLVLPKSLRMLLLAAWWALVGDTHVYIIYLP